MKSGLVAPLFASALAVFVIVAPVSAHHAVGAKFDSNKPLMLSGVVTKIDWLNPHAHVFINVQNGNNLANWAIELESPVDLGRSGWKRDTIKPGDTITVQGPAARDGSKQLWANSVSTAAGRKIFALAAAPPPRRDTRPAPRWPDGHPRLGPPPGERGYWGNPSASILVQTGANVQANPEGVLRNINDVDKVAPFQRWARDLFELRQRTFLKDDPMFLYCKPPGGPRQFQLRYGIQFVEELYRQRIWVMIGGGNHNWRFIYTDGRNQADPAQQDFGHALYYGRAVGKWEGDTLVVDTKDFNENFWFSNGGLPHTTQLHLIERISRPDFGTLKYDVTIDDPGAYTKTWTSSWTLQWIAGEDFPVYYCQDNRP
jgi:Family of unknown function (DUF6152)